MIPKPIKTVVGAKRIRLKLKTSSLPLLSSIDEDNLPEPEEDNDEEREFNKPHAYYRLTAYP